MNTVVIGVPERLGRQCKPQTGLTVKMRDQASIDISTPTIRGQFLRCPSMGFWVSTEVAELELVLERAITWREDLI